MEVAAPTGLTSQRRPVRAWSSRASPFKGFAILFRGCGAPAVREWVVQCRGMIPRRVVAWIRL
jgi:hypothetical protein